MSLRKTLQFQVARFGVRGRKLARDVATIEASGIFDVRRYLDCGGSPDEPIVDYCLRGWHAGLSCCYLFDADWYLQEYADVRSAGINPLVHYLKAGEREGRRPSPLFDPGYYGRQVEGVPSTSLLAHFINVGAAGGLSPNCYFDTGYYVRENPDVLRSGRDPYYHYLFTGFKEGRKPSASYDFSGYRAVGDEGVQELHSPLASYLYWFNGNPSATPSVVDSPSNSAGRLDAGFLNDLRKFRGQGEQFAPSIDRNGMAGPMLAQLFAFYLPQFHPIPENDAWWGTGFTEWSNTVRGLPRFEGHYQPHLAGALGYYDLRQTEVMRRQVELAKAAGVSGFCFYYYHFNGKRLLETPVDDFLQNKDLDLAFCLMWANENWTRRWDGLDNEILIKQDYLEEHDDDLVDDFARHFMDERYLRIDDRPVLIIYRPGIIPEAMKRLRRWRDLFRSRHGQNPLVFMAQAFGDHDPMPFGFDGAIEFPPHKIAQGLRVINNELNVFDPTFSGHYFSYDDLVASSLAVDPPEFPLIRTAVPMWDNEARKPGRGMGFASATPEKYENWLRSLINYARAHPVGKAKQPLLFVNAWNEWAEGAHLEPDVYWGHAYLNATRRAVTGFVESRNLSVIYVGHDAHRHGAQMLSLNIVKTLTQVFGIRVEVILLEGGALEPAYSECAPTHVVSTHRDSFSRILEGVCHRTGAKLAICNTTVTGKCCREMKARGIRVVSLVHELENLIKEMKLEKEAKEIQECSDKVLFASDFVRKSFESIAGALDDRAVIRPQGVYQNLSVSPEAVKDFRARNNIPRNAKVVVNVGYGDLRKGYDLFVGLAKLIVRQTKDYYFLWIGNVDPSLARWTREEVGTLGSQFLQIPFTDQVAAGIAASDVFALTSREDPFPSVVMEALCLGLPVVGFRSAGGFADLLEDAGNGSLVAYGDLAEMASQVFASGASESDLTRKERSERATQQFRWNDYVFSLLETLDPGLKRVSVVVPNYNCKPYIEQRLASIFRQDYPIYEIILLDDASADDSLSVALSVADNWRRQVRMVRNEQNSGSVFRQWSKGANAASGDFLWIAEADDDSSPRFLSTMVRSIDPQVAMVFCDSEQIDQDGKFLAPSYQYYYGDSAPVFRSDFRLPSTEFAEVALGVRNLVLNVSSVLFRRPDFVETMSEVGDAVAKFKVAGDWVFYAHYLHRQGRDVMFVSAPMNVHRRHVTSVTGSLKKNTHLKEIETAQHLVHDLFGMSQDVSGKALRYRAEVELQFSLTDKGTK